MALAELREAEAPPEIAALYAALREASGVPLVNLIHRHLATLPGVLPWMWEAIRPPLLDGTLAAARDRLAAQLVVGPAAPLPAADWAAAGLPAAARATARDLVAVYNRGNLTNLILLTALHRELTAEPRANVAPPAPIAAPAMLPAPPPLPRLEALAPEVRTLVEALAARHGTGGVVPSLYLHLAHWPALLAALPGWMGAALAPASLDSGRAAAVRLAEQVGDALRPCLALRGDVPGGQRDAVLAVIGQFTRRVIPGMISPGLTLERVLEAESYATA